MILHKAQSQIASSTARFRVINAGRRFGKTLLSVEEIKGLALAKESRICYIAPTFQQARDICWDLLKKELRPITKKVNESRLELEVSTAKGGTSTIVLRGWEAVETLRGQSFDFLIIDEVASMRNFWNGWNEVLSPTLIDRTGSALFISTPKGFNHFYDLYNMEAKDKSYKSFHFTTYDNPNVPKEEIERERLSKPENAFAQEYLADFRKREGLVYKEFDREKHLYDDLTPRGTVVLTLQGIDWGYVHNAVVINIEKTADEHYWVTEEWSFKGKTDEETIAYAGTKKANKVYPDPENPQAVEKAKRAGLNAYDVVKGKGSIDSGVDTVRELFKQGRLHVHKSCIKLISSLEVWAYIDGTDKYSEEGKDENDAMRYPLMMEAANVHIDTPNEEFGMYANNFR